MFLKACQNAEYSLTTTMQPAFWLAPGEKGTCDNGGDTAVNDSVLSDQILERTVEIGFQGIDNAIAFTAKIHLNDMNS